jgi:hypothetical protein
LRQIADVLSRAGYRSRGGGEITHRQVGRWLSAARHMVCPTPKAASASCPSRDD